MAFPGPIMDEAEADQEGEPMAKSRPCRQRREEMRRRSVDPSVATSAVRAFFMMVLVLMLVSGCAPGTGVRDDAAPPCDKRRMTVTTDFASRAGRIGEIHYGGDGESLEVCYVFLLVSKDRDSDLLQIIDEAVRPHGWERQGEATWVNTDGFKVTARDESGGDDPEHPTAEYEVTLSGTAAK